MIKLCNVDEVEEGIPLCVEVEDYPKLAVYNINGTFYVTDNLCTHGNALLTDGFQEGDIIECPFHGGSFCVKTGKAINLPCEEPLKVYKIHVENGEILLLKNK